MDGTEEWGLWAAIKQSTSSLFRFGSDVERLNVGHSKRHVNYGFTKKKKIYSPRSIPLRRAVKRSEEMFVCMRLSVVFCLFTCAKFYLKGKVSARLVSSFSVVRQPIVRRMEGGEG